MGVLIDANTRLLIQGITGREAASFTVDCVDYGTNVVAGVTPGKGGDHVYGVPVFDTVDEAVAATAPNAALISVPPALVLDAALEAIEACIPLLVLITERAPRRDVAVLLASAREAGTIVIGPNSLGLITPADMCKVGSIGGPAGDVSRAYTPGRVGVASRSGGMTTEISSMLSVAGIGQSTAISIGGDPFIGTTLTDAYRLFVADEGTDAVVTFSEPGGAQEDELADYLEQHGTAPKPLVCFVAGRFVDEMPDTRFGHAGTMVEAGGSSAHAKIERLRAAGAQVPDRLEELPALLAGVMVS